MMARVLVVGLLGIGAAGVALAAATPPKAIETPAPQYPKEEEAAGHGGRVALKFKVTQTGTVESVEVVQSTGYPKLDEAALAAGRNWRFEPAKDDAGMPVAGEKTLALSFKVQGGSRIADTCAELTSQVAAFRTQQPEGDLATMDTFAATTGMMFVTTSSKPMDQRLAIVKGLKEIYPDVAKRCEAKPEAKYMDVLTEAIDAYRKSGS